MAQSNPRGPVKNEASKTAGGGCLLFFLGGLGLLFTWTTLFEGIGEFLDVFLRYGDVAWAFERAAREPGFVVGLIALALLVIGWMMLRSGGPAAAEEAKRAGQQAAQRVAAEQQSAVRQRAAEQAEQQRMRADEEARLRQERVMAQQRTNVPRPVPQPRPPESGPSRLDELRDRLQQSPQYQQRLETLPPERRALVEQAMGGPQFMAPPPPRPTPRVQPQQRRQATPRPTSPLPPAESVALPHPGHSSGAKRPSVLTRSSLTTNALSSTSLTTNSLSRLRR